MKLGIDFGTTRIVTAAADRGNYPLLTFDTREGNADWFPSLVALRGDERRYGWDAWTAQGEPGWTAVRSLKRILEDAGADTSVEVDGARYPLMELLTGMLDELRRGLALPPPLEVMLGVPANANSNQRFLTVEAFRRAGFQVLGLLNEPSAAAIEFGHSQKLDGRLLVYDLGGGTFDASRGGPGRQDAHRRRQRGDRHARRGRLRPPAGGDGGGRGRARRAVGRRALPAAGGVPAPEGSAASEHAQDRRGPGPRARGLGAGHDPRARVLRALPAAGRGDHSHRVGPASGISRCRRCT